MIRRFTSLWVGLGLFLSFALACSSNHQRPSETATTGKAARGTSSMATRVSTPEEPDAEREQRARAAWAAREAVGEDGSPTVVYPVLSGVSRAVRDLPPERIESDLPADREGPENRPGRLTRPSSSSASTQGIKHDPYVLSTTGGFGMPPPIQNFEGQFNESNFTQFGIRLSPPDTNGDVGPSHYVQQVNILVQIWSKTGTPLAGPFKMSSLYSGVGGVCSLPDAGDPVVLYDPLADRWLLSQFGFADPDFPPYHQCIAVSKTGDPTGAYYVYDFITPGKEFPDYPKLGVWPDGYYMTTNQFFNFNVAFDGAGMFAFDRKKMLLGDPTASLIYFNLNLATHPEGVFGMLPSDIDGFTPPPAGRPNTFAYFIANDFGDPADGLRLFDFHADFAVPASSTFTERPESTYAAPLLVAPFDLTQPAGRSQVPQPPPATSATGVDAIADRLLHRLQYRNFGTHETLVMNHTVGAPGSTTFGLFRAAPRYYVLNRPLPGGNFTVADQATHNIPDGVNRWMGSAAMDHEGNLALGYSVSNTTVFPGIRYAGRLASDPPGGLFQGENTLINGTGSQTSTASRWGDYSMLAVDPVDDCTFWYTQEYYTASGTPSNTRPWRTRIGSFRVNPSCVTAPHGQIEGTVTFCDTGLPAPGTAVEVSDGHTFPVQADGSYFGLLAPGNYTIQVVGPGCDGAPTPAVVVNNGTTFGDLCISGSPAFRSTSQSVSGGNGDGIIEQNECNKLFVTLNNIGCAKDTGVTATLASSTPGVTVDPTAVPYPDMNERAGGTNTIPFAVSTSSSFACGSPIDFVMTVKGSGGTQTVNFSMPTCTKPDATFSGGIVAGDPTQSGRVNRNGVTAICEVEPFPANPPAGTFHFKQFSFANDGDVTACVKITVNATGCAGPTVYPAAYLNSFNPANIATNFLGAPGVTVGIMSWSVNVAPHSNLVVVVTGVTGLCPAFNGTVSGLLTDTDGGGDCGGSQLTALSPANVWLGLKNSDDVGTNFDLKAEIYKNNTIVGTGEVFNVPGGSSGFNNAKERAIALGLSQSNVFFLSGDKLSIKLYARIGATGHRSGTARLWFNDAAADTEFDATIGGVESDWYIRAGGGLLTTPGAGPKTTIDLFLDRAVGGNPYKPFGTWTKTF